VKRYLVLTENGEWRFWSTYSESTKSRKLQIRHYCWVYKCICVKDVICYDMGVTSGLASRLSLMWIEVFQARLNFSSLISEGMWTWCINGVHVLQTRGRMARTRSVYDASCRKKKKKTFRSHVAMFGHLLIVFQSVAESHFECLPFICHFFAFHALRPEVLKLWGASSGGAVGRSGGRKLFVWGAYLFWTKYGRKIKCIFW
jgi:hypothetical protein